VAREDNQAALTPNVPRSSHTHANDLLAISCRQSSGLFSHYLFNTLSSSSIDSSSTTSNPQSRPQPGPPKPPRPLHHPHSNPCPR